MINTMYLTILKNINLKKINNDNKERGKSEKRSKAVKQAN